MPRFFSAIAPCSFSHQRRTSSFFMSDRNLNRKITLIMTVSPSSHRPSWVAEDTRRDPDRGSRRSSARSRQHTIPPLPRLARLPMSEAAREPNADRINPRITLAVLSVSGLAYAVLSSAIVPALPTIQHSLHTTETGVTWLLTGYLLSASVGTAILGRLGDMYGKEHVLLWTLGLLAVGTLLSALSHSLGPLIAGRVIQ